VRACGYVCQRYRAIREIVVESGCCRVGCSEVKSRVGCRRMRRSVF
jgi:hypothetical protein